ncbi:MAG TPA: DMT family transporter [Nocardioidaceae bacterium]|nr:DMT family transporter [Nocardioidaceae bacterium]
MPRSRLLPLLAVATTLFLWASAFVAIRHLGPDFSPGALSLGRLLVGSACLGALVAVRRPAWPSRGDWPRLVAIGLLWYAVYNVALNAAETRIDAGTASILIQVSPIIMTVLAVVFLRERPSVYAVPGLAIAFVGVVVIAFATSDGGPDRDWTGVGLALLAALAYSVSMIAQKPLMGRLPAIQVTWVACTVGAVACLPFLGDLADATRTAPASSLWWVVYLGVFPTAIAFTTWAFALSHMDASSLGVTTYLVPPITVLLGWLLLGEVPPALAFLGGALALAGVALTRKKARVRRTPDLDAVPAPAPALGPEAVTTDPAECR